MRKRLLGFILAVSTLLVLTPDTVMAAKMEEKPFQIQETTEQAADEGSADNSSEMEGVGTETAPYRIKNAEQLRAFADMVNGVNGAPDTGLCAVLTCNIDLCSVCGADIGSWTPIGTNANPYTGIFDGGSFAITDLYCRKSNSSYAGLFGCNAGIIKNLGVAGADIAAGSYTGGVCGYNSGIITGCYNAASVNGADYTGGVCGYNNVGGTVSICYNMGAVSGRKYVGGICGYNKNTTVDCYNMGSVYGKRTSIGGICGYNRELVSNCFNTGAVKGEGKNYIGSVCGYNHSKSSFLNCYYLITGEEKGNYGLGMTQEQFASGEVCWLLNDGKGENVVWHQTCGAGFPAFGGKVVYQVRRPKTGGSADEMIVAYTNEKEKKQNASAQVSDSENTHGHVYQEPEWEWKEYSYAEAVFTCQDCGEKLSLEASISEKTTKATCGKEGETVYTASVDRGGETYTDKKTVKLEKPEHQPLEPVSIEAATCTKSGIKRGCFTCPVCGKYFEDQEGQTELSRKEVVEPAGHLYTKPEWEWNLENNPPVATAVFNCERNCGKTVEKKGRVTADKIADCTTTEEVVYTAVVGFSGETYSDKKPVSVQQIPHSYGKPEWDWAKDFSTATATFTCKVCKHTEAKPVTPTKDTTPSTCTKAGKNKHTAVIEIGGKEYSDVKYETLPLGSHNFGEPVWTWAKDNKSATATFTCGNCKKSVNQTTDKVTEKRPEESTCGAPGEITYTATVTFEEKLYNGTKTEKIVIDHTLQHFPEVSAKCETDGNEECWQCSVCSKWFDAAGKKEISGKPVIPATGHKFEPVPDNAEIYMCTVCLKRYRITLDSNGTPTMHSVEDDAVIPQDEAENQEETQQDTEPQSKDEQDGEADQSEPESQNGETGQNVPEDQDEQSTQSEQDGQSGQNEDESSGDIPDMLENAARYGLIYPEGEEADSVTENTWEESAINLRVTSAGKTAPQTVREQQQQQRFPLWVSVAVLSALAGVVLVLFCKGKVVDDKR